MKNIKMGRPTKNPKIHRLEIRLSEQELEDIKSCADFFDTSKSDVIFKAINLLKSEIIKNKNEK